VASMTLKPQRWARLGPRWLSIHKTSFIYCSKCFIKNTLRVSDQNGRPQALCKYHSWIIPFLSLQTTTTCTENLKIVLFGCRIRWPCVLRRWSAAALLLWSPVRISLKAWMSVVFVVCWVGSVLCYELITRSEES